MKIFANLIKIDEDLRVVEGYASTEALDSQGEVVTREAISGALSDYMKFANVREMHQPSAVGKTQEAVLDDKGLRISVKVVDDVAWKKVKEGVYNGFSIGVMATQMNGNRIEGLSLHEISLVDRPACPEALFNLFKLDEGKTAMSEATATVPMTKADVAAGHALLAEALLAKSCGLYSVSNLAAVLDQLSWVTADTEWEKQYEGDESKVPEMLRAGYALLADALKAMATEETDETKKELEAQATANAAVAAAEADAAVVVELADKPKPGATVVAKAEDAPAAEVTDPAPAAAAVPMLTDEQKAALRVIWQLIESAGLASTAQAAPDANAPAAEGEAPAKVDEEAKPEDEPNKDDEDSDEDKEKAALTSLFKSAGFETAKDALAAIGKAQETITALRKEVAELSAKPAAVKGVLRVLDRDGSTTPVAKTTIEAIQAGESAHSVLSKMFSGELSAPPVGTSKIA